MASSVVCLISIALLHVLALGSRVGQRQFTETRTSIKINEGVHFASGPSSSDSRNFSEPVDDFVQALRKRKTYLHHSQTPKLSRPLWHEVPKGWETLRSQVETWLPVFATQTLTTRARLYGYDVVTPKKQRDDILETYALGCKSHRFRFGLYLAKIDDDGVMAASHSRNGTLAALIAYVLETPAVDFNVNKAIESLKKVKVVVVSPDGTKTVLEKEMVANFAATLFKTLGLPTQGKVRMDYFFALNGLLLGYDQDRKSSDWLSQDTISSFAISDIVNDPHDISKALRKINECRSSSKVQTLLGACY